MLRPPDMLDLWTLDPRRALWLATLALVVIGTIDFLTPERLSLSAVYLLPILIAGWNCGWRWAAAFAVFAFGSQLANGLLQNLHSGDLFYFDVTMANRLVTYLLVVFLIGQLRELYDRERDSARSDELTGVMNRRGFHELLEHEIVRHERSGHAFCVAYLDCDRFKSVNDSLGHAAGDRLLRGVATALTQALRRSDSLARLGGDEFAILLPETDADQAGEVVRKLRAALSAMTAREGFDVTFSIGVSAFVSVPPSVDRAIDHADSTMYAAKAAGRDTTVWSTWGDEVEATGADRGSADSRERLHAG
ncbi:MAG: GGDEF domain-containing protein [Candidatus Levyibacteriota bacterium]